MAENKPGWDDLAALKLSLDDGYLERTEQAADTRRDHRVRTTGLRAVLDPSPEHLPLRLTSVRQGTMDGTLLDLSRHGLRALLPQALDAGEQVKVGLQLSGRQVTSQALVKWARPEARGCEVGLEFQDMRPQDEEYLAGLALADLFSRPLS